MFSQIAREANYTVEQVETVAHIIVISRECSSKFHFAINDTSYNTKQHSKPNPSSDDIQMQL